MQAHRFVTAMPRLFKLHLASGVCMQAGPPYPQVAASVVSTYAKIQGAKLADQRIGFCQRCVFDALTIAFMGVYAD